jgi:hypothetical protein
VILDGDCRTDQRYVAISASSGTERAQLNSRSEVTVCLRALTITTRCAWVTRRYAEQKKFKIGRQERAPARLLFASAFRRRLFPHTNRSFTRINHGDSTPMPSVAASFSKANINAFMADRLKKRPRSPDKWQ